MNLFVILSALFIVASASRLPRQTTGSNGSNNNNGTPSLGGVDNGLAGGVISAVSSVTGQLINLQRALNEVGGGLARLVQATTRLVGGTPLH